MSHAGKNIRKIRMLKGYSQNSFAELFSIKRATIGAYEEGRAEPKIDFVISVANYFGISMELLLTKELTVNELSRFDSKQSTSAGANTTSAPLSEVVHSTPSLLSVPLIPATRSEEYQRTGDTVEFNAAMQQIQLPAVWGDVQAGFEVAGNEMAVPGGGLRAGDWVLVKKVPDDGSEELVEGAVYLLIETLRWRLGRARKAKRTWELHPDNDSHTTRAIKGEDVHGVWKVVITLAHPMPQTRSLEERIGQLEARVNQLEEGK